MAKLAAIRSRSQWIGLSVVMGAARVTADDWPQWRGPMEDGSWNEPGVRTQFPADGLPVSWRVAVGRGWSGVVVADGRAVVMDARIENGSATERILCFNESDGQLLWSHEYPVAYPEWALEPSGGGPRATPIIRDGRVTALGALGHLIDPTSPFGSKQCAWTPPAFANRHVFVHNDRELLRVSPVDH